MDNTSHIEQKRLSGYLRERVEFVYLGGIFPSATG